MINNNKSKMRSGFRHTHSIWMSPSKRFVSDQWDFGTKPVYEGPIQNSGLALVVTDGRTCLNCHWPIEPWFSIRALDTSFRSRLMNSCPVCEMFPSLYNIFSRQPEYKQISKFNDPLRSIIARNENLAFWKWCVELRKQLKSSANFTPLEFPQVFGLSFKEHTF
jgi:hypothetical protein